MAHCDAVGRGHPSHQQSRAGQKITLQCQPSDLGMQRLQVDHRCQLSLRGIAKYTGSAFQQLIAPLCLIWYRQVFVNKHLPVPNGRQTHEQDSIVAGTPIRLILGAVCSLEDALDAAQIQR